MILAVHAAGADFRYNGHGTIVVIKQVLLVNGLLLVLGCVVAAVTVALILFHLSNPYARRHYFVSPYETEVDGSGNITYVEHYRLKVFTGPFANALGYYGKNCFLILQNTFFGGKPAQGATADEIIDYIHRRRFDPSHPYLISGDQFSVLYPRNLGVFYNQLLDPNTAHNPQDWEGRQRIYVQSVLVAIDGLSASADPRTTVVPIGPRHAVLTQVHPGGVGSDQVYGLFYALAQLLTPAASDDGRYTRRTKRAAQRILRDRQTQLQYIYDCYLQKTYDPVTSLVKADLHMASARDGVVRSSSFYDNVIMYETIRLAEKLGLESSVDIDTKALKQLIEQTYWNEEAGYYNDDLDNPHFSSDWLIGYPAGFFDLSNKKDVSRTRRTVAYIERSGLAEPFPIKYQIAVSTHKVPFFVRHFVPSYGRDAIWSYWGAQYITLLCDMYGVTGERHYLNKAAEYVKKYEQCIVRDAGFAETFDSRGNFLRSGLYKSIRITGWVVQFEHAAYQLRRYQQTGQPRVLTKRKAER